MKGIIFTEFLELVEDKFGLELLEEVLEMSEDEGIYTSVGSYDHKDLVRLIINLSKKTDIVMPPVYSVFLGSRCLRTYWPHCLIKRALLIARPPFNLSNT